MEVKKLIKWVSVIEKLPLNGTECLMYRKDAGVFTGFYGNIAENLDDLTVEKLYNEGMSEEGAWECFFWSYGFHGMDRMEMDLVPEYWANFPSEPCA